MWKREFSTCGRSRHRDAFVRASFVCESAFSTLSIARDFMLNVMSKLRARAHTHTQSHMHTTMRRRAHVKECWSQTVRTCTWSVCACMSGEVRWINHREMPLRSHYVAVAVAFFCVSSVISYVHFGMFYHQNMNCLLMELQGIKCVTTYDAHHNAPWLAPTGLQSIYAQSQSKHLASCNAVQWNPSHIFHNVFFRNV